MANPIDLMFNKQRRAALGLLLLHPTERFYVREISRLTGVAAGSLHRELRSLTDAGLLIRQHKGNNVYYQADTSSKLFPELAAIFHKTNDLTGVLRDAIMPLGDRVAAAFIYYPRIDGRTVHGNGINMFVIGSVTALEVEMALENAKMHLDMDISPEVMRANEFSEKMENGDPFVTEVMSGSMMFVKGLS
jgi:DNA-binding transcriptional ArsR family regulator